MLRDRVHVWASRSSTVIVGSRLTLEEARAVIADETFEIKGMDDNVAEVRNYRKALFH